MKKITRCGFLSVFLFSITSALSAQSNAAKRPASVNPAVPAAAQTPLAKAEPTPPKRNSRPVNGHAKGTNGAKNAAGSPTHFYEFERPGFTYGRVLIEHDDRGRGKISFLKDGYSEMITDPIELSAGTMTKLTETFDGLNFLTSNETYQYERDFSNMGNVTITLKRDGRERTAKYNWTDNELAKELMDEYRRISNEYTWRFEVNTAIENQPLQLPGLMDRMDSYITRSEISDPPHLIPLLSDLSTNERLPLMARNRAAKIVKQIEKASN